MTSETKFLEVGSRVMVKDFMHQDAFPAVVLMVRGGEVVVEESGSMRIFNADAIMTPEEEEALASEMEDLRCRISGWVSVASLHELRNVASHMPYADERPDDGKRRTWPSHIPNKVADVQHPNGGAK